MSYKINPQTAYNGMLSGQRNMFLTSSIAIAILGFSNKFKNESTKIIIKIFGLTLFIMSIYIGFKTAYDFDKVLYKFKKQEHGKVFLDLLEWSSWKWVTYIYTFMLVIIILLYLFKKLLNNK